MKRLSIYKNNILTNQLDFESQEDLEAGLAYHQGRNSFGVNASSYQQLVTPEVPSVFEDQEILDLNGTSFDPQQFEQVEVEAAIPAVYETVNVPAEYTVEITDITNQLAQEAINASAEAYLNATDKWATREAETGIPQPEGVKAARAAARASIVE